VLKFIHRREACVTLFIGGVQFQELLRSGLQIHLAVLELRPVVSPRETSNGDGHENFTH
jgi:hypothetical protein